MTTVGMIRILEALKQNLCLVKFKAENNRLQVCRRFLALVADLVIYHNRSLRILVLTVFSNVLSNLNGSSDITQASFRKETKLGKQEEYLGFTCKSSDDTQMLERFKKLIKDQSMLRLFVI